MSAYTNATGVPLSIAVYLATDNYDYDPNCISASTLIKPVRQTILAARVPANQRQVDVLSLVKSKTGSAIHDSIEQSWLKHYKLAMLKLGYPQEVIERIHINPSTEDLKEDTIPVYMEQRAYRQVGDVTVSGKFDFVAEGRVEDFKTTSTFTYIKDTKDEDYQLQGSIYRWLNPTIITEDHMAIQFIFTDWMPGKAAADPMYPKRCTEQRLIPLLSLDDTEAFIVGRLDQIKTKWHAPDEELPLCTDAELWRKDPEFKYYKNPDPAKRSRSTKNFDTAAEAYQRRAEDGNVGVVIEVPGQVIACKYCRAFPVCKQKDALIANGSLILG